MSTPAFDCIVIGAGVAGCTTARMLTSYEMSVAVLEAGNDIACGATRANSGIVHAGYDPAPDTDKARYNVRGSKIFPAWAEDLGFAYRRNGSLVLAFSEEELATIATLEKRAVLNEVEDCTCISAEEVRALEPNVAPGVMGALYARTGAICDPYDVTYRSALCAAKNGAEFFFGAKVVGVKAVAGAEDLFGAEGADKTDGYEVRLEDGRVFRARTVVNAAGVYADDINNFVSAHKIDITPVRGEYCLYDPHLGGLFNATMFQTPTKAGKGVLVATTVHGNLFVGPNSVPQEDKESLATTKEGLAQILTAAKKTWPGASAREIITNFAGLRAHGSTGDFVIGEVADAPGFFNIACFESPGLTSAPAVAEDIAAAVAARLGAPVNEAWEPRLAPAKRFALMTDEERAEAVAENPRWGKVVCRCCNVTEGEIADAMHSSPELPVQSLDALKWRTGATMGRCHGGFCSPEIVELFAREYGVAPEEVDKRQAGSYVIASSRKDYMELAGEAGALEGGAEVPEVAEDPEEENAGVVLPEDPQVQELTADVAIVGAGAAGLAAAESILKHLPEAKIVVLDRAHGTGGIMNQCIHNGFGLHRFSQELSGPEYAFRQTQDLAGRVEFMFDTTVMSVDGPTHTVHAINETGVFAVHARAVVLATGSRERGLGALNIAGDRPSGVFTAGSAQAFVNLYGCLPGKKVVMQGSGDIGLIMARRMALSGMDVMCVYNRSKRASGLERNVVQCLNDFDIPLITGKNITRLEGKERLEAIWVADVDQETKQVIPGTDVRVECDTLVLSIGLVPENELAASAGAQVDARTGGCVVDDTLETCVPGVFACGNAVHIHGLADDASAEADAAGVNVARFLGADVDAVHVDLNAAAPAAVGAAAAAAENDGLPEGATVHNLVCVACPKGCHVTAVTDADGDVIKVEGHTCRRGLAWAQAEAAKPMRVLTVCVNVPGALQPLSVRTTSTIPRALLRDAAAAIYAWSDEGHIEAPVHVGDVVMANLLDTGVDVIATKNI